MHPNIENHTDYNNKIISLQRIDFVTGKKIYAVINLGHNSFDNYQIGVSEAGHYKTVINSNWPKYGGQAQPAGEFLNSTEKAMHGKAHSVTLPKLVPYGVIILEK